MNEETLQELRVQFVGSTFQEASDQDGLTVIYFNDARLSIYAMWRLVIDGRIMASSVCDGKTSREVGAYLQGAAVTSVTVQGRFHDLECHFDNGASLQLFASSTGYEHWNLHVGEYGLFIAGPDSLWSYFGPAT